MRAKTRAVASGRLKTMNMTGTVMAMGSGGEASAQASSLESEIGAAWRGRVLAGFGGRTFADAFYR